MGQFTNTHPLQPVLVRPLISLTLILPLKQVDISSKYFFTTICIYYREEVAKMWHKREAEWEREKVAREKLMAEVLHNYMHQYCEWGYTAFVTCKRTVSGYTASITCNRTVNGFTSSTCNCTFQVITERQHQIRRKMDSLKSQQVCT